jgi:uncharacterized membrane protein
MLSRRTLDRIPSRLRLVAMIGAGVVAAVLTGMFGSWRYAMLIGWDVAALTFTLIVWVFIGRMSAQSTATHTAREDPGRTVSDLIVLVASVASLAAVGVILAQPGNVTATEANLVAGLGLTSVALSWTTVHTLYTLRYARLYYAGQPGGIDFNQDEPPRYLDFAYVAFTVGMTFQIADTDIRSSAVRANVLRHALLSYLFGAVILAAAINLVVGIAATS